MHPSVQEWVQRTLTEKDVTGRSVLEVGSYDVNGSVRPHIESLGPSRYLGVDAGPGPRVDQVVDCERLTDSVGAGCWDVVVSTEMLEHVRDWRTCMTQMAAAVALNGLLLITTRGPGFPYHPYPEDHWRYTTTDMRQILSRLNLAVLAVDEDDYRSPGVLALAVKPLDWTPPDPDALQAVDVAGVTP